MRDGALAVAALWAEKIDPDRVVAAVLERVAEKLLQVPDHFLGLDRGREDLIQRLQPERAGGRGIVGHRQARMLPMRGALRVDVELAGGVDADHRAPAVDVALAVVGQFDAHQTHRVQVVVRFGQLDQDVRHRIRQAVQRVVPARVHQHGAQRPADVAVQVALFQWLHQLGDGAEGRRSELGPAGKLPAPIHPHPRIAIHANERRVAVRPGEPGLQEVLRQGGFQPRIRSISALRRFPLRDFLCLLLELLRNDRPPHRFHTGRRMVLAVLVEPRHGQVRLNPRQPQLGDRRDGLLQALCRVDDRGDVLRRLPARRFVERTQGDRQNLRRLQAKALPNPLQILLVVLLRARAPGLPQLQRVQLVDRSTPLLVQRHPDLQPLIPIIDPVLGQVVQHEAHVVDARRPLLRRLQNRRRLLALDAAQQLLQLRIGQNQHVQLDRVLQDLGETRTFPAV